MLQTDFGKGMQAGELETANSTPDEVADQVLAE